MKCNKCGMTIPTADTIGLSPGKWVLCSKCGTYNCYIDHQPDYDDEEDSDDPTEFSEQ